MFPDADKDGFGSKVGAIQICKGQNIPHGFVSKDGDCNDSVVIKNGKVVGHFINPDMKEECDNVDNNCDGKIDEGCPVRPVIDVKVADPVVNPPAASTSTEIGIIVVYADDVTRTMSVQEYDSETEIGAKGWTHESMVFHGKVVSISVSSQEKCGARFNVASGDPATSWICMGNNSSAKLDPNVTVYKVILATNLWIDVTKQLGTWSDPTGQGCSAKLKLKENCGK